MKPGILLLLISLSGCAAKQEDTEAANSLAVKEGELACSLFGGLRERVCPTSFYTLLASTRTFDGRVVAIKGYLRVIDGVSYLFPHEAAAADMDIASSILCEFGSIEDRHRRIRVGAGLITLIGRFSNEQIETSTLFQPAGRMDVMVVR